MRVCELNQASTSAVLRLAEAIRSQDLLHLGAGEQECADAFLVLIDDRLVDVVVVVASAVGRAAEAADLDRAVEDERAVGIGGDELLLDALPGAFGVRFIGLREIAHAHALGQRVGEHAGELRGVPSNDDNCPVLCMGS